MKEGNGMRQKVISLTGVMPLAAPKPKERRNGGCHYETELRGLAVLTSPALNKGTAFTADERKALVLTGLLPPEISTLEAQVKRAYFQYEQLPDALSRNIYLAALHDRNDVLFYRLFSEHLREMIPIVNDLTVGIAMMQYHHECRRPRGLYLSIDHAEVIEEAFASLRARSGDIELILATDAEQVLGIGDWGIGGMEVSIGKLAIYTAAAGIHPARVIPVMLDVGTNRESLHNDPMYIGNRHTRVRGKRYDAFIHAYVKAATKMFPAALLQWVDFAPGNGRRILKKYHDQICTFNDDLQGTGAVTLAAAISAVRVCGTRMRDQRVVIFGAGMAGIGIADQIRDAMVREGLPKKDAVGRFWCVDRPGLLTTDMAGQLRDYQETYARPPAESKRWKHDGNGHVRLAEVVRRVQPTMLIGTSTAPGSFTEAIIKEMAAHTKRPIIFPLSNPMPQSEATPADLIAWTDGRALIATGSPFAPVTYEGVTYAIGHVNNPLLYPGLCLGTIVSRSSKISAGMFAAAANALSSLVTVRQRGAALLPHIDDLRSVALTVAVAVAEAAEAEGVAGVKLDDIVRQVQQSMWQPEYCRITAC
jgi:malate dehydrogenase (oxaloacetate-decarboxylating)